MKYTTEYQDVNENREVKSTLFAKIFTDKKELLDLYNAINGSTYTNEEDILEASKAEMLESTVEEVRRLM